jgi:hypothetical protein
MTRKPAYAGYSREQLRELIEQLRAKGLSWRKVAEEIGVSLGTLQEWAGRRRTPSRFAHPRTTGDDGPSEGETTGETMPEVNVNDIEERIRTRDAVAAHGAAIEQLRLTSGEILKRLDALTRQPLRVDSHDGRADISCPTCGTHAAIETGVKADDFDKVVELLETKHKQSPSGKVVDCPECRPKLDAALKEMGYALTKAPPTRK